MRDQELIGLYEAYQQVHTQQRVINEEVEIASHYFCEMGLNEIGVEILIEELGVEEFAEFVYDISEDYYLTEARAAKKRTGGKSYAEVKAEIDNKEAAKKKVKDEKQSAAVASAANQQPKKKGLLGRVADAVAAGIDRHNYAMKASEKTAGKIGKAAREFGTGLMSSYDNWVGQLISDGYDLSNWTDEGLFEYYEQLCEESLEKGQSPTPGGITPKKPVTSTIPPKPPKGTPVNTGYKESYDIVFEYLISEGYADTNENALVIMANMSEEWREEIINEAAADQSDKQIEKGVKTTYRAQNVLDNLHQGRSKGLNKLPRGEREEKTKRMRGRLKTRRDDLFGERNRREDETRAEMKRKYGL